MHKRNMSKLLVIGMIWITGMDAASASTFTYNFDTFNDGTSLSSQYGSINFTNATVLRSGFSLNESSFPPRSGDGLVFDDGGPIVIVFSTPAQSVSGFFTYLDGLTLSAYDSGNNLLSSVMSAYETNLADGTGDPGSSANELLRVSSVADQIASIVISASAAGNSLVLDDLTVTTSVGELPEPGTFPLFVSGLALAWILAPKSRKN